jgi:hypothetical protein
MSTHLRKSHLAKQPHLLTDIGKDLYLTFFGPNTRQLFDLALSWAEANQVHIQIVLKFDMVSELQEIPWELLHDNRRALSLGQITSVGRYIEQLAPLKTWETELPIRVLLTTSLPKGEETLNLDQEVEIVRDAIKTLKGGIDLRVCEHISLEALRWELRTAMNELRPFQIWHHCGHGGIAQIDGRECFYLALEGPQRCLQAVSAKQISSALNDSHLSTTNIGLCLALINVCHSGVPVGLAPSLAALNIPCVIGFRDQVIDTAALDFAHAFYQGLLELPVGFALAQARRYLFDPDRPAEWTLSMLFMRHSSPAWLIKPKGRKMSTLNEPSRIPAISRRFNSIGQNEVASRNWWKELQDLDRSLSNTQNMDQEFSMIVQKTRSIASEA